MSNNSHYWLKALNTPTRFCRVGYQTHNFMSATTYASAMAPRSFSKLVYFRLASPRLSHRFSRHTCRVGRRVGVCTVTRLSRLSSRHSSRAESRSCSRCCVLLIIDGLFCSHDVLQMFTNYYFKINITT